MNTDAPDHATGLKITKDAARELSLDILEPVRLNFVEDVDEALEELARSRADTFVDLHAPNFYGRASTAESRHPHSPDCSTSR